MESILNKAADAVLFDGARFSIDLKKRSLKINGKYVIENGEWEGELGMSEMSTEDCLKNLEHLYKHYKHSIPSERTDSKRRTYFKALKESELSDEDMMFGGHREFAQFRLESILLGYILNGSFVWDEEKMGKWFWQSETDKDFVILREWVE